MPLPLPTVELGNELVVNEAIELDVDEELVEEPPKLPLPLPTVELGNELVVDVAVAVEDTLKLKDELVLGKVVELEEPL